MKIIKKKTVRKMYPIAIALFMVYILFKLMYFFIVVESDFLFYSLIAFIATIFLTSKSKKSEVKKDFIISVSSLIFMVIFIYNMFTEHCKEIYGCGYATDCYMLPEKKCHKGYEILFSEIFIKSPEKNTKIYEYAF